MATGMRVMDGNQECELWAMDGNWNAGNGWQPELWAMDGNQNVRMATRMWQWMATGMWAKNVGNAGNGWQPE